jgi:hypothetical protein
MDLTKIRVKQCLLAGTLSMILVDGRTQRRRCEYA